MELSLIPETLSAASFVLLIVLSAFTSLITASMGIGGGTVLLATMAQLLPVTALIPVHGAVQAGSNFGRAAIMLPKLRFDLTLWFVIGSLIGATLGGQIAVSLPRATLQLVLGGFILFSVWGPKLRHRAANPWSLGAGGIITTLLTMLVGATGPLVVTLLRSFKLSPQSLVATSAFCMVIQHLLKVLVFGLLGFAFADYLALMALMIASGFIGTLVGKQILLRLDPQKFSRALNLILTILALRLIYSSAL